MKEKRLVNLFLEDSPIPHKFSEKEVALHLPGKDKIQDAYNAVYDHISVDAVLYSKSVDYVVEAKTVLNRAVIGDVLSAKVIYEETKAGDKRTIPVIIVERTKPILEHVCHRLNITLLQLKNSQWRQL